MKTYLIIFITLNENTSSAYVEAYSEERALSLFESSYDFLSIKSIMEE